MERACDRNVHGPGKTLSARQQKLTLTFAVERESYFLPKIRSFPTKTMKETRKEQVAKRLQVKIYYIG